MAVLVENTLAKLTHLSATVKLKPGFNSVPDEAWAALAETKFVKAKLAAGHLVVDGVAKEVEPAASLSDDDGKDAEVVELSDYSATEAVKVVKGTLDKGLLEAWALAESRSTVIDAIEKQLEKLEPKTSEGDKKE